MGLEFHITVMGNAVELQDGAAVTVSAVPGELLLRRSRNPLDWICPYRVPHVETAGAMRGRSVLRWLWPSRSATSKSLAQMPSGTCRVKPSGNLIELRDARDKCTKAGKPQEQWTGKLWNLVHRCRMQEMHRTMWYESWGRMGRCTPHVSTMMLLCSLGRVLATPQWVLCCGRSLRKTCWRTSLQQLHQSVMCVSSGLAQRLISYFSAFPACLQTSQGMCSVAHLPSCKSGSL